MTTKPADYDALETELHSCSMQPPYEYHRVFYRALAAIRDLRAERDALRKALKTARTCIAMELEGWIDSHGDTEGLYMAKVLPVIDAALAAQEKP